MPKTRVKSKKTVKADSLRVSFKLGGRKSTKSANQFSLGMLREMLDAPATRNRDKNKIRQVIDRKVKFVAG